jgi:hypothetical protein
MQVKVYYEDALEFLGKKVPGDAVQHCRDPDSYGMIIAYWPAGTWLGDHHDQECDSVAVSWVIAPDLTNMRMIRNAIESVAMKYRGGAHTELTYNKFNKDVNDVLESIANEGLCMNYTIDASSPTRDSVRISIQSVMPINFITLDIKI